MTETNQDKQKSDPQKPQKKHWLRKIFKYFFLLLLLIILCATGAVVWVCQFQSGQDFLVKNVNNLLATEPGQKGLSFKITSLSGSLPFNFSIGLEGLDEHGFWLTAPDNQFVLNWRELPKLIHIEKLKLAHVGMQRLPDTPPAPAPKEPAKPFSVQDLQGILAEAGTFLNERHWWLPDLKIEDTTIEDLELPDNIIPQTGKKRLLLNAILNVSHENNIFSANLEAGLKNADSSPISLDGFTLSKLDAQARLSLTPRPGELESQCQLIIRPDQPVLAMKDVPAGFPGSSPVLSLTFNAISKNTGKAPELQIIINGPDLEDSPLVLAGNGHWQSGPGWQEGRIDGPLEYGMKAELKPVPDLPKNFPLNALRKPVELNLALKGQLPKASLDLAFFCPEVVESNHVLDNIKLSLKTSEIELPLQQKDANPLEQLNTARLDLSGSVDKNSIKLLAELFFQQLKTSEELSRGGWHAGFRDLDLNALGAMATGGIAAILPKGEKPRLDGTIQLDIKEWQQISSFIPDYKLDGHANAKIALASVKTGDNYVQNGVVDLHVPDLQISQKSGQIIKVKKLESGVRLADIFDKPELDAALTLGNINAANMNVGSTVKAAGSLAGPLRAEIKTTGNITSHIAGQWEPGKATLGTLSLDARIPGMGAKPLGIRSRQAAIINYGEQGLAINNLDIAISPSGNLRANGSLSADKLDFNLVLADLNFKPWQALLAQLPSGSASVNARIKGAPQRPVGDFKVNLKDIKVPGVALAPISLVVQGAIQNSGNNSVLAANMEIDRATLKTLGSERATINARIPLLFGQDGIPSPNMNGNLAAKIVWDGALGPIWNLLPMPDKRLNGRIAINVDAAGTLKQPRVQGGIKVDQARFEDLLLGVLITNINMRLNLSEEASLKKLESGALPGAVTLELSASDGHKGTIAVNGKAGITGNNLDLKAKINHLRPLRRRDVHIELSGDATVKGNATAPDINGEIIVNQGEVLLDNLDIAGSVTTLPISENKAPAQIAQTGKTGALPDQSTQAAKAHNQGRLNVKFVMLPRFFVDGRGLTSVWKANMLIDGTPQNPHVTGNIDSVKGNFDFLGKNFTLTKGIVFFGGGSLSNPLLDIELTNETPDLIAHIIVTGPVNKMKLALVSEPELPRDEILSRVLFGRSISDLSRLEALQLAGAVAQLAGFGSGAGGILDVAKKTLGVDVLRLGNSSGASGQPGDQTAGGTTIEMGKYINDMIYLGVQQGLKPDSTAFIIQLELTPRTSLELRTEQENTWGGIRWKYNY